MKKSLRLVCTVVWIMCISLTVAGQERKYEKALKSYKEGDLERALLTIQKTKADKSDTYYRRFVALKGHIYYEMRDFEKALEVYQDAYDELGPKRLNELAMLRLVDIKYGNGNVEDCLTMLQEIKNAKGAVYGRKPFKLIEDMCYFTQEFADEKEYIVGYDSIISIQEWENIDLGENVISFGGAFYKDSLVFSSYTEYEERDEWELAANEGAQTDDAYEVTNLDLYIVPLSNKKEKVLFSKSISTMQNEGALCFNSDFTEMYFTRHYETKTGADNYKIHYAIPNKNGEWVDQGPLSFCSDKYSFMQPQLSPDGGTLYFSSNKPGGKGKADIYYAKGAGKKWSSPVNLGAGINTPYDDVFPYMRNDSIMFFASNGHVGFGGFDLFWVNIKKKPSKVHNLKAPINTKYNEYCLIGHNKRPDRVLFFSERGRENGEMASILPDMSVNVTPVPFLMDMVEMPMPVKDTTLNFDPSQFGIDHNIDMQNDVAVVEPSLKPEEEKEEIDIPDEVIQELESLEFQFNSYELKNPAKETLKEFPKFMAANPDVRLVISGHADQIGKEDYNMMLSTERARETMRYLTEELDMDANRFVVEANGEYFPLVETMDKEEAKVNRRVEFRMFKQKPESGITMRFKPDDDMPDLINNLEALFLDNSSGEEVVADVHEIKVKDIYRAKEDITLSAIAEQFGVSVQRLKEANNLYTDDILKAQIIMIPL